MSLLAAGAMGAGALANYFAAERQVGEQRKARKSLERSEAERLARIQGIDAPELSAYDVPEYDNLYDYSPEMLEAIQQERSSLESFEGDPRFANTQLDALRQLAALSEGGLTEGDRLAMTEAQIDASRADRGRQEAILQALARRGVAGGGQELAARLSSSQQAADQAAAMQRSQLQAAQQRGLQALAQQGQMATEMRGQEFGEAARRAAAADAINRFNVQNRMGTQSANVAARNRAQLMGMQAAQRTSDLNRDVRERKGQQANQLEQQRYINALNREGITGNVSSMPAQMQVGEAATRARGIGQGIQSATGAVSAFGYDDYWDERDKQLGRGYQGPANRPGY